MSLREEALSYIFRSSGTKRVQIEERRRKKGSRGRYGDKKSDRHLALVDTGGYIRLTADRSL